jgi:hypothetical protein
MRARRSKQYGVFSALNIPFSGVIIVPLCEAAGWGDLGSEWSAVCSFPAQQEDILCTCVHEKFLTNQGQKCVADRFWHLQNTHSCPLKITCKDSGQPIVSVSLLVCSHVDTTRSPVFAKIRVRVGPLERQICIYKWSWSIQVFIEGSCHGIIISEELQQHSVLYNHSWA